MQIPKQGERRERELQELVRKGKRPVALFVDEAHDLNGNTLTGLKRLMEVVEDGGGRLSVVLAGHPKLRNDLRRPTMEEIGYRTDIFTLDGITGSQRESQAGSTVRQKCSGIQISYLGMISPLVLLSTAEPTCPLWICLHSLP